MTPIVVHVVRPFATEQEYLNAEAWSIDARSMLLIDVEPLPPDSAVLFDVALADGHKPIRAEGRVVGPVAAEGARPGGLRVKFKRFGAATKAFIERAVKAKASQGEPERPSQPRAEQPSIADAERPSSPDGERVSLVDIERLSVVELERPSLPELQASLNEQIAAPAPAAPEPQSGVTARKPALIVAPPNREELLARLRRRRSTG
jgi:hypothetical protein